MQQSPWDDGTTIAVRESTLKPKEETQRAPLKIPKPEIIPCIVSGCAKLFISVAERDNHVDFHHNLGQDTDDAEFEEPPPVNLQAHDVTEEYEGDATIMARLYVDQEQTIKPQLTAASLQALNSIPSDPIASVTQSLYETSIHDELIDQASIHNLSIQDPHESAESIMSVDETTYSVNDPMEDEDVSDISQLEAPEIRAGVKITLILFGKCLNDLIHQSQRGVHQRAPRGGSQGRRNSHSVSKESLSSSVASSDFSGAASLRRKRSSDDPEETTSRKNPKRNNSSQQQEKPLACPFHKYDARTFGFDPDNSQYSVCSTWCDVKTAYLKQHLIRNHCLSEFACDRCFRDMTNIANLRAHRRADPPCPVGLPDENKIMPEDQVELGLRTRNAVGLHRETYWYRVYDTIWGPEARRQRPVEPYYTGPYKEILQQFLNFSQPRMPGIIRTARQALHLDATNTAEQDVQLGQTILQEAMQAFLHDLTHNRPPSIQQLRALNPPAQQTADSRQQIDPPRDINRPLPNILPNWPATLPIHVPQPTMQNPRVPLQNFQQTGRPVVSAPTTPAPMSVAPAIPESINISHDPNYDTLWQNSDPNAYDFLSNFELLPSDSYLASELTQSEVDDYVVDDYPNNSGPSNSSRRERRL